MLAMAMNRALKAIRQQRRLHISDVAKFATISEERLRTFEDGKGQPSRKQLERLAQLYGVPLYRLTSDTIPNIPDTPPDFRKADPKPSELSPRGMKSLFATERIATFSYQLAAELKYSAPDWSQHARRAATPAKRASALRESFEAWRHTREADLELTGSHEQKFLTTLRLFFEAQGGVLNINDAPASDYMGFYMKPDRAFATIFVNRSISSKKAQLFTLAHEYAHALMNQEGISNPFVVHNSIERSCNLFAAEFLAPIDRFRMLVEDQPRTIRSDVFAFIATISARTLLSNHATAIRLAEAGYLSQKQLRNWEAVWAQNPKSEKAEEAEETSLSGGVPHAKRVSEIGYLPIYLSAEAMRQRLIDSIDVQNGIGLSEMLQDRAFSLASRRLATALR